MATPSGDPSKDEPKSPRKESWFSFLGRRRSSAGDDNKASPPTATKSRSRRGSTTLKATLHSWSGSEPDSSGSPLGGSPSRKASSVGSDSDGSTHEDPLLPSSAGPRRPVSTVGPLTSVPVVGSVRAKGYGRVNPGDVVMLMEAINVPRREVMAMVEGALSRLPRSSVLIDQHTCNVYLDASVRALLKRTDALVSLCSASQMPDRLLDILSVVPCALSDALRLLVDEEVHGVVKQGRVSEILRYESPAVKLLSAIVASPPIRSLQRSLTATVVASLESVIARSSDGAPPEHELLEASSSALTIHFGALLENPPPTLAAICRALDRTGQPELLAGEGERPIDLLVTVVFLRIVCPAIVQSDTIGGITGELSTPVKKALLRLAKVWQQLANGMDDIGSASVRAQWLSLSNQLHAVSRVIVVPDRPAESLEHAALALYRQLEALGVTLTEGPAPTDADLVDGRAPRVLDLEKRLATLLV